MFALGLTGSASLVLIVIINNIRMLMHMHGLHIYPCLKSVPGFESFLKTSHVEKAAE